MTRQQISNGLRGGWLVRAPFDIIDPESRYNSQHNLSKDGRVDLHKALA